MDLRKNLGKTISNVLLTIITSYLFCFTTPSAASEVPVRLTGHVPAAAAQATHVGRLAQSQELSMTVALSLRNQAGLEALIKKLHDPKDPMYGQFLTQQQFAAQFGPTNEDKEAVVQYLSGHNLRVSNGSTSTLKISGPVSAIETAFNLEMHQYKSSDNRDVYAPNMDPEIDSSVSGKISAILGLNNFTPLIAHRHRKMASGPSPIGTGPGGGLSPSDIQKAYSFNGTLTGSGQSLALMELDGYTPSDITAYAKQFTLPSSPALQNVLVDGYDGSAGDGADEVTLDIELMMAVAPGASKILVYEGPNTETGPTDVYGKIADDNIAKQVSTSWGSPESQNTSASMNSENTIFMQMAAQGQSIYAAAGDSGAYDDGTTLSVDDPASQPYMVGTGGTTLALNSDGSYKSESSWGIAAQGQNQSEGGGGGISSVWPLPTWQTGLATTANKGSTKNRMVPDISMNANPDTGYAIYVGGSWSIYGGTSCAAPLWAGFTALVNQQRASSGFPNLGFANLAIYSAATGGAFAQLFHDVNDQSTNLYYPAITGYDLSTGWGSMNATALISNFAGVSSVSISAPTNVAVTPHNQVVTITWTAVPGAISYAVSRSSTNAGPYTTVSQTVEGTSYVDVGLQNGTTYFYQVKAQTITSQSAESTTVSGTPILMVPEAPTQLTVVPSN